MSSLIEIKYLTPRPKLNSLSSLNTQDTLTSTGALLKTSSSNYLVRTDLKASKSPIKSLQTPLTDNEGSSSKNLKACSKPYLRLHRKKDYNRPYQLLAYACLASVFIVVCLDFLMPYTASTVYCNTHQDCPIATRCPANGFCIDGSLTCANGFVVSHGVCIKDTPQTKAAYRCLDTLEELLRSQPSEECGDDLCFIQSVKSAEYLLSASGINATEIMPMLVNIVKIGRATSIQISIVEGVEVFLYKERRSILPRSILKLALVMGVISLVKLVFVVQDLYSSYQARKYYEELKLLVLASHEGVPELYLKEQLCLKYSSDGNAWSLTRWPLIENLRKEDLDICRYEAVKDVKPVIYWQKRPEFNKKRTSLAN